MLSCKHCWDFCILKRIKATKRHFKRLKKGYLHDLFPKGLFVDIQAKHISLSIRRLVCTKVDIKQAKKGSM